MSPELLCDMVSYPIRRIIIKYVFICIYIYIYVSKYVISRRSVTPQRTKYNSKSLDVEQSLYFGSKLPSSGTYK